MADGFRRARAGISCRLSSDERELLIRLFNDVVQLLAAEGSQPDALTPGAVPDADQLAAMVGFGSDSTEAVLMPSDPALARLLPDAHRDDSFASAEFRRYTEHGLRARKRDGVSQALSTLNRVPFVLGDDEAAVWLVALNDVRLVVGARLGLRTDEDLERLLAWVAGHQSDATDPGGEPGTGAEAVEQLQYLLDLYEFLTWFQETLVAAVVSGPSQQ
ncbi:MAG: DUF2017 domain-containing protein [Actinomycetota bacterium]